MKRPRVLANFAVTVDGKISTRNFTPSLFTSPVDKSRLQEIRASVDAVLAGRGTVAADTMSMGLSREDLREARRICGKAPVPLRVVLSNSGRLDPAWKVFSYRESPLVVFSTTAMPDRIRTRIAPLADLFVFEEDRVPLAAALGILREHFGVRSLVCEGGGTLMRTLLEEDLVDEIHTTIAPVIFGGATAPTMTGQPGSFLPRPCEFRIVSLEAKDGECFLHLRRRAR